MQYKDRYGLSILLIALLMFSLISCGKSESMSYKNESDIRTDELTDETDITPETLVEITVTAGDKQLNGVLFDNETAKLFAEKLPLTVDLWNTAPGFAKAFDLVEPIPDIEEHTRSYELGGLAYWHPGPSIAIFHSDHLEQTIVPVVTIGKINDDVSLFAEYEGSVSINDILKEGRQNEKISISIFECSAGVEHVCLWQSKRSDTICGKSNQK